MSFHSPSLWSACLTTALCLGLASPAKGQMEPFVGEIRWVAFDFEPTGWAFCDGRVLPIAQNTALFSLLGTSFGGDGRTTFKLPDLQGRAPRHAPNAGYDQGNQGGAETVTLTVNEMPPHNHVLYGNAKEGDASSPASKFLAKTGGGTSAYGTTANGQLGTPTGVAGGNQPHDNMKPSLVLNCIIALQGIYPSRP